MHIGANIKPSVNNCPRLCLRPLSTLRFDIRADTKTAVWQREYKYWWWYLLL